MQLKQDQQIQVGDIFSALEMDLIRLIKSALDLDFANAIRTGSYANNYQSTIKELNSGLVGKEINLSEDLKNVTLQSLNSDLKELRLQDLTLIELDYLGSFIENYLPLRESHVVKLISQD